MAETELEAAETTASDRAAHHGARHPSPKEYVRIAVILALVTGAEVAVYYIEGARDFLIPLLFLFSIIKFTLVVLWYMHLKFDSRTYSRFFLLGLAGAITLYLIVLLTFQVFSS